METTGMESLQAPQGIPLYGNKDVNVFVPRKPNVPISEGLQVQVEGTNPKNKNVPKDILTRELYAIMAAKVIAEGNQTPEEAWANTRIEDNNDVNTYGRNATNPDSWRRPVDSNKGNAIQVDKLPLPYDQEKLQRIFRSYMHRWEKTSAEMALFDEKVRDKPIDISTDKPDVDKVVWESDSYVAKIIASPHLKGTHIVVDPKLAPGESIPRQWMTKLNKGEVPDEKYIKMTLESTAIALGIRDLLGGGRGEIHNSGNWASGLKDVKDGGVLDTEALQENSRQEKRAHRPDVKGGNDFGTFMHVHVYIPEGGRVTLPIMSEVEAADKESEAGEGKVNYREIIEQWKNIPKTTQEKTDQTRERLGNNNLSNWVNANCSGKLTA